MDDKFYVDFYKWAKEDFIREVNDNFTLLKTIESSKAWGCVSVMEIMSNGEQIKLAKALVKRGHKIAIELTGEYTSKEEQELIKYFNEHKRQNVNKLEEEFAINIAEGKIKRNTNLKIYLRRTQLASLIRKELKSFLGNPNVEDSKCLFGYSTQFNNSSVWTRIDLASRYYQMEYFHIFPIGCGLDKTTFNTSIFSWLGLNSVTWWDRITDDNKLQAALSLAKIINHFVSCFVFKYK